MYSCIALHKYSSMQYSDGHCVTFISSEYCKMIEIPPDSGVVHSRMNRWLYRIAKKCSRGIEPCCYGMWYGTSTTVNGAPEATYEHGVEIKSFMARWHVHDSKEFFCYCLQCMEPDWKHSNTGTSQCRWAVMEAFIHIALWLQSWFRDSVRKYSIDPINSIDFRWNHPSFTWVNDTYIRGLYNVYYSA